jgi:hypothetical protein
LGDSFATIAANPYVGAARAVLEIYGAIEAANFQSEIEGQLRPERLDR